MNTCPLVPLLEISMQSVLHKIRRADGNQMSRMYVLGYLRGAAGFISNEIGARSAYEIVQRLADELAAESINQRGS